MIVSMSDKTSRLAETIRPRPETSSVAIAAPGQEEGFWAGAPSSVYHDGYFYLAYRLRQPVALGRGQGVIIARSPDGVAFTTIGQISKDEMDAESLERPTLVKTPGGKWRLYLSCATRGTKHWRVELLEADDPSQFQADSRLTVLPGDGLWGVKDTVIARHGENWHLWATCHPLDVADQEDRMISRYATSADGVRWEWQSTCLKGRDGQWDARGARVTAVVFGEGQIIALYDGRANARENFEERTGLAVGTGPGLFKAVGQEPWAQSAEGKGLRYVDVLKLPDGTYRLYYELSLPDGSHEVRTQLGESSN